MDEEKRIWSLRLNLDDFNSEYLKLRNDGDRFAFFLGFHCGCMNGDLSESDPKPFESGYGIGSAMHSKALALSQANAGSAKSSVDTRRLKYGTAQPSKRTSSERSSERSENAQANAERSPERLSSLTIEPSNDVTRELKTKKQKNESFSAEAEEIYKAYPKKVAPDKAKMAIEKALSRASFSDLLAAVQDYAKARKGQDPAFTKHPQGWFNDSRWLDDRSTWAPNGAAEFEAPTLQEWMDYGENVVKANPTHSRQMWPKALAQAAYHGAAANGWRGVTDWKGKILSECLRWVGNENGRART